MLCAQDQPVAPLPITLVIETVPTGATIYMNGKSAGIAPIKTDTLSAGQLQILAKLEGFKDFTRSVNFEPGTKKKLIVRLTSLDTTPSPAAPVPADMPKTVPEVAANPQPILKPAPVSETVKHDSVPTTAAVQTPTVNDTAQAKTGFVALRLELIPTHAKLSINGTKVDSTPYESDSLTPGNFEIIAQASGYKTFQRIITLEAGARKKITLRLSTARAPLSITSTPDSALVYIDDILKGTTPYTTDTLPDGSYFLRVEKKGYDKAKQSFMYTNTKPDSIHLTLVNIAVADSIAQVKHKKTRFIRQIACGSTLAVFGVMGVVTGIQANQSIYQEQAAYNAYKLTAQAQSNYDARWNTYSTQKKKTDSLIRARNISSVFATLAAIGLVISIKF